MTHTTHPGGRGRIGEFEVARVGYGAMQLGPESTTTDDAVAVLRRAVELGVNHVDTASFYTFGEVDRRIRQALAHTPNTLLIAGTRSVAHLEENIGAGDVVLDADALARLDAVRPSDRSASRR
jgi:pyridoxine 4-dehydrogenase